MIKNIKQVMSEYEKNPKRCPQCQTPIEYLKKRQTFCSQECNGKYYNFLKKKRVNKCAFCGKDTATYKKKFCCFNCSVEYDWKEKINHALKTGLFPYSARSAKNLALRMRGNKCEICGITEWRKHPVPLVMDHINGNSEDNRIENLRLVCGNCDMQLPTYKSKNKGNGRHSRRERYAEGKSY